MFPTRFRKILAGIEKISIMKNRYSIFRYHRPILAILHRNLSFSHFGIDIDFWYRYPVSIPNGPPRSIGGPPCQVWSSWVMNWLQGETSNTKKTARSGFFPGIDTIKISNSGIDTTWTTPDHRWTTMPSLDPMGHQLTSGWDINRDPYPRLPETESEEIFF